MNKLTEKQKTLQFIKSRYPDCATSIQVAKWAIENYITPETATRRLRELRQEGYIRSELARAESGKSYTKFWYIPPRPQSRDEVEMELLRIATS